jgi:hypothetical protein
LADRRAGGEGFTLAVWRPGGRGCRYRWRRCWPHRADHRPRAWAIRWK